MRYNDFERLMTSPRMAKYKSACGNNKTKTQKLYRANIRLSGAVLATLSVFEVVLRNKIDAHYKAHFPPVAGGPGWLREAVLPGGFLSSNGCHNSAIKINEAVADLRHLCTHDRLVAKLSFGFWKFLFKGNQFMAGGSSLLAIFPNAPAGTSQGVVFAKLNHINDMRNRVAHHEPVCFDAAASISTVYVRTHFQSIADLLSWMGINSGELLTGIDSVTKMADFIDNI